MDSISEESLRVCKQIYLHYSTQTRENKQQKISKCEKGVIRVKKNSQWSKDVRKALIDKDMNIKELANEIGYSSMTVSSVINGRYSNASYQVIAEKINKVLGTVGLPERIDTPSNEWCQAVKIELVKQELNVNKLAKKLNVSRDRLSLVINGKMMNEQIVDAINSLLNITLPAIPSGDN